MIMFTIGVKKNNNLINRKIQSSIRIIIKMGLIISKLFVKELQL